MLGFKYVHIWVEPPKSGDEYIFFARSDQQRKPMKREKLREWYKTMLEKAKAKNVVESYGTMHDLFSNLKSIAEIPLFHGDQWEITVREALCLTSSEMACNFPPGASSHPAPVGMAPALYKSNGCGAPNPLLQVPSLLGLDQDDYDGPKGRNNGNKIVRMDSKDVVQKAQQEMQHLKRHFLVATLYDPDMPPMKDNDPVISTDLTDSRQTFLGQCQMCHWQFNTLRHAQYSTMMILNHIHNKVCARGVPLIHLRVTVRRSPLRRQPLTPSRQLTASLTSALAPQPSYCIEECTRGRVEDGSFMVGCDVCDNWYACTTRK